MKKSLVVKFVSGLVLGFLANKAMGYAGLIIASLAFLGLTYNFFKEGE